MQPLQDGYPDLTLVGMLSRDMQMTLAMTLWQAVMATHQVAGMWPLAGDRGRRRRRREGVKDGGKRGVAGGKKAMRNGGVKGEQKYR